MSDITPPDYTTTIGQVRLLIPDTEQLDDPKNVDAHAQYIFSDAQIQAFIALYNNNIKRAAAAAKLALATSEALIGKVIKTYDFSTDGAKLAAELRAQAKQLQDEAREDDMYDSYDTFMIIPPKRKWDDEWP